MHALLNCRAGHQEKLAELQPRICCYVAGTGYRVQRLGFGPDLGGRVRAFVDGSAGDWKEVARF